jgi:hypothetical protein
MLRALAAASSSKSLLASRIIDRTGSFVTTAFSFIFSSLFNTFILTGSGK